jgi:hypothetical protein
LIGTVALGIRWRSRESAPSKAPDPIVENLTPNRIQEALSAPAPAPDELAALGARIREAVAEDDVCALIRDLGLRRVVASLPPERLVESFFEPQELSSRSSFFWSRS